MKRSSTISGTLTPLAAALGLAIVFAVAPHAAVAQEKTPELSQAEAETAARSVARFCKILVDRMDDLIEDQWATQDLGDLASVWNSLACHEVFGIDERVRWLVR